MRIGGPLFAAFLIAGCAQNAPLSDESKGPVLTTATNGQATTSQTTSAPAGNSEQQTYPDLAGDLIWTAAKGSDLRGTWTGVVDCGKGPFELQLKVSPSKETPQMIGGQAMFKPSAGNKYRQGASRFIGEVTNGDVRLRPNGVVKKSVNLPPVSMQLVARKNPDRLVGEFVVAGCRSIDLRRPAPAQLVNQSKTKAAK